MATPLQKDSASLVLLSGDQDVNALLYGTKWGGATGTGSVLTYSFGVAGTSLYSTGDPATTGGYGPNATSDGEPWHASNLTSGQQVAVQSALTKWAEVANVTFAATTDTNSVAGDL